MSKMQNALAWAQRGFRVFPLKQNGKEPTIANFGECASADPAQITAWWRDPVTGWEKDHNIGVLTTGMVVVDIDVKDNKPGMANYLELGGHFETLMVETPSGGYHAYFTAEDSANTYPAEGVDIRSHNGYVLAPGSRINGKPYLLCSDAALAPLPAPLAAMLRRPCVRRESALAGELDDPNAIVMATQWLEANAPVAIEGQSGDVTTYTVACKLVRDFALSDEMALELLLRCWNERCCPPWDAEELWGKVQNASQYAIGALGGSLPSASFDKVHIVEPPQAEISFAPPALEFGNAYAMRDIPARPWLVERLLMRGAVTVISAAGAAGKTTLALTIAAHGAVAQDFAGYRFRAPFKTVLYSAEEDRHELSRRLYALCVAYQLDWEAVRQGVMLAGSDDIPLTVATQTQRQVSSNKEHVDWLIGLTSRPGVGLVVLDPLVELHTCDENDTVQMRFVMSILREVARRNHVAVLAPHHTSKGGSMQQNRAGNADISRGAGSIVNSARVALTLVGATDKDCEVIGIQDSDKALFVRLDDAKMNLALANGRSVWFKKEGVKLYNGDDVGVLRVTDVSGLRQSQSDSIGMLLAAHLVQRSVATMPITEAVRVLKSENPLYAHQTDQAVRQRVEAALGRVITTESGQVSLTQDGPKKMIILG